jgi:hypothetical protein
MTRSPFRFGAGLLCHHGARTHSMMPGIAANTIPDLVPRMEP